MERFEKKWSKAQDRYLSALANARLVVWGDGQGTYNEGRNKAKRERRAMRFGSVWVNPRAAVAKPTKAVQPAYRVKLPIATRPKVLTHAPRNRKGSTTPLWMKRLRNRRRDALRRAAI